MNFQCFRFKSRKILLIDHDDGWVSWLSNINGNYYEMKRPRQKLLLSLPSGCAEYVCVTCELVNSDRTDLSIISN